MEADQGIQIVHGVRLGLLLLLLHRCCLWRRIFGLCQLLSGEGAGGDAKVPLRLRIDVRRLLFVLCFACPEGFRHGGKRFLRFFQGALTVLDGGGSPVCPAVEIAVEISQRPCRIEGSFLLRGLLLFLLASVLRDVKCELHGVQPPSAFCCPYHYSGLWGRRKEAGWNCLLPLLFNRCG